MRSLLLLTLLTPAAGRAEDRPPNFIVIFCDDLGYGDLGCFGHPTIATPHLDKMAAEGTKLTGFYVAASVCTPSRAGLLTGRLPARTGMCSDKSRVLFPWSAGGLPQSEVTVAEMLKDKGYATGCVGKWHLGHLPKYLPTNNGFDSYFGIPYSNDMDKVRGNIPKGVNANRRPKVKYFNVPLMRGTEVVERPADQRTITRRYGEQAVKFIDANATKPFFLYLAHNMPHVPLFASSKFHGVSERGVYGEVVTEIDASVGRVLAALKRNKIDENTLVIFTSDNGPWLPFREDGGSAGLLRGGKGSTWEGGMRVPCVARWPGKVPAGRASAGLASTLDLLPTFGKLAGAELPAGHALDGYDISPLLFGTGASPREEMFFYRGTTLFAVRSGPYKAHFRTRAGYGQRKAKQTALPELYHLGRDPGENYNIAKQNPEVIAAIKKRAEEHRASFKPAPTQLEARIR